MYNHANEGANNKIIAKNLVRDKFKFRTLKIGVILFTKFMS